MVCTWMAICLLIITIITSSSRRRLRAILVLSPQHQYPGLRILVVQCMPTVTRLVPSITKVSMRMPTATQLVLPTALAQMNCTIHCHALRLLSATRTRLLLLHHQQIRHPQAGMLPMCLSKIYHIPILLPPLPLPLPPPLLLQLHDNRHSCRRPIPTTSNLRHLRLLNRNIVVLAILLKTMRPRVPVVSCLIHLRPLILQDPPHKTVV